MDRENTQIFIRKAEKHLASARTGLLIAAQSSETSDLATPCRDLARLHSDAVANGLSDVVQAAERCLIALDTIAAGSKPDRTQIYSALDLLAGTEAAIWKIPLASDNFLEDVSGFVDASFSELIPKERPAGNEWDTEAFDIDDETLEIFQAEAEELLANIKANLTILNSSAHDQNALWEIRRNAHTFKGAAGIVGLSKASAVAHQMEDLLDKLVERKLGASPGILTFLTKCCSRLDSISASKEFDDSDDIESEYRLAMDSLDVEPVSKADLISVTNRSPRKAHAEIHRTSNTPIVRVSLDRLDELLRLSRKLQSSRKSLIDRFGKFASDTSTDSSKSSALAELLYLQSDLTDELHAKLLRIRMVRFGTLETRLSRAVHVTSLDEYKKALVEIENPDVEIDTQVIDALIEPLLHLLKNAVVHGIEPPETRRLIGKPESGTIRIGIEADNEALVLTVSDDGNGISIPKLKEKAITNGVITKDHAKGLNDHEALKLIFDRGLTTAEKLDLNAGRGVGMSIVKESIESRGGSVLIESTPGRGTTFTILMPLAAPKPESSPQKLKGLEADKQLAPLILVVDDSPSVRRQSVKLIENAGLRVITANNGADALELLLNGTLQPDLILSDIEMPQINGWEFLEYVKTDENFGHIPVVIVSSLDGPEHRELALSLGAADYLVKPLTDLTMNKIIEAVGIEAAA